MQDELDLFATEVVSRPLKERRPRIWTISRMLLGLGLAVSVSFFARFSLVLKYHDRSLLDPLLLWEYDVIVTSGIVLLYPLFHEYLRRQWPWSPRPFGK